MAKNLTLSLDDETASKMEEFKEVKWSEIARQAILKRVEQLEIMNKILSKSKLDREAIKEISNLIEKNVREKRKWQLSS